MIKLYRPIDLARATGLSTQTIRNYERLGFMPPAGRSQKGFRLYTELHRQALLTSRTMIEGFGWRTTVRAMREVHSGRVDQAVNRVNAAHAKIHADRLDTEANLAALRELSSVGATPTVGRPQRPIKIREAAQLVNVRTSALRHWEVHGLLTPTRDPNSGYRLYDTGQIRRLRVVSLLRRAGYGIDRIREIVDRMSRGDVKQSIEIAEKRLSDLAVASRKCVAATAAFWEYVQSLNALKKPVSTSPQ